MGNFFRPAEMNATCDKMTCMGMKGGGFSLYQLHSCIRQHSSYAYFITFLYLCQVVGLFHDHVFYFQLQEPLIFILLNFEISLL
jgi:hypothetical protein